VSWGKEIDEKIYKGEYKRRQGEYSNFLDTRREIKKETEEKRVEE
jgi:hypothetical protein